MRIATYALVRMYALVRTYALVRKYALLLRMRYCYIWVQARQLLIGVVACIIHVHMHAFVGRQRAKATWFAHESATADLLRARMHIHTGMPHAYSYICTHIHTHM